MRIVWSSRGMQASPAGCLELKPARKSYGDTVLYLRVLTSRHCAQPSGKSLQRKVTNWIQRIWFTDEHISPVRSGAALSEQCPQADRLRLWLASSLLDLSRELCFLWLCPDETLTLRISRITRSEARSWDRPGSRGERECNSPAAQQLPAAGE